MNVFPDTEVYCISWPGGSCGAFVSMCIYNLVVKEVEIQLSVNGHAHNNQVVLYDNYEYSGDPTLVDPKDINTPLILVDHNELNIDLIFTKFPKCKIIYTTVEQIMIPRLIGNLFFKNLCEFQGLREDPDWEKLKINNPYMKEYTHPKHVPLELVKRYILSAAADHLLPKYSLSSYTPPHEHAENIFFINFYDIIHNITKVLKQLSFITQKPITQFLVDQANKYVQKQEELVKTKMPWLDDKYRNE